MARMIESTTDTQEAMEAAVGKSDEPIEEAAAPATEAEEAKPEAQTQAEAPEAKEAVSEPEPQEAAEEAPGKEEKLSKKGFLKRLEKLNREKQQLQSRLYEYEQRLSQQPQSRPEAQPQAQPQSTQPLGDGRPKIDQFETYDAYVEALADWKFQQRLTQAQIEAQRQQQMAEMQRQQQDLEARVREYKDRVAEASAKYEDWDEVTNKDVLVPPSASIAIVELDNGPDVTYYLGKHPEIVEELHSLTPAQQIARIALIGHEIKNPPKIQSRAPAPVVPVGGSVASSNNLPASPSYKDYRRKWLSEQF
jgi:hypothetical protein